MRRFLPGPSESTAIALAFPYSLSRIFKGTAPSAESSSGSGASVSTGSYLKTVSFQRFRKFSFALHDSSDMQSVNLRIIRTMGSASDGISVIVDSVLATEPITGVTFKNI